MSRPLAVALAALTAAYGIASSGLLGTRHIGDGFVYEAYQRAVADGFFPYREFAVEYPPLALAPVLAVGDDMWLLAFQMAGCLLVCGWAVGRLAGPGAVWAMAVGVLCAGPILSTRFDLLPAALVVLSLLALVRERPHLAFALLGAGVATKLWPVVVAPAAMAWLDARGERRVALVTGPLVAAAVVVACAAPFASSGLVDSLTYHLDRPAQIESSPATVLWLTGGADVTGTPTQSDEFKSNGLRGGASGVVLPLFTVLLAAGVLAAAALARRGPPGDARQLVGAALAAVLAFVVFGKVLSPQYFAWLLPLGAAAWALGLRVPAALLALAAVLTQVEFPDLYQELVAGETGPLALVAVRNLVLLMAFIALAAALGRSPTLVAARPRRSRAPRSATGRPPTSRSAPSSAS